MIILKYLQPDDVEEMYVEEKEKDSTKDSTVLVIQETQTLQHRTCSLSISVSESRLFS